MAASYSTLSKAERSLTTIPVNPQSVHVSKTWDKIHASVINLNGERQLNAKKIGNDSFDVEFVTKVILGGKPTETSKVSFTTSESWINQWIDMAHSEARDAAKRLCRR